MKRLISVLSIALLLSSCSPSPGNGSVSGVGADASPGAAPSFSQVHVCLVMAKGELDDGGINQGAWEAMQELSDENGGLVSVQYLLPRDNEEDYAGDVSALAEKEGGLVILAGPGLEEAAREMERLYPSLMLAMLDAGEKQNAGEAAALIFLEGEDKREAARQAVRSLVYMAMEDSFPTGARLTFDASGPVED